MFPVESAIHSASTSFWAVSPRSSGFLPLIITAAKNVLGTNAGGTVHPVWIGAHTDIHSICSQVANAGVIVPHGHGHGHGHGMFILAGIRHMQDQVWFPPLLKWATSCQQQEPLESASPIAHKQNLTPWAFEPRQNFSLKLGMGRRQECCRRQVEEASVDGSTSTMAWQEKKDMERQTGRLTIQQSCVDDLAAKRSMSIKWISLQM